MRTWRRRSRVRGCGRGRGRGLLLMGLVAARGGRGEEAMVWGAGDVCE